MNLTEFIADLQSILAEHGDIPVMNAKWKPDSGLPTSPKLEEPTYEISYIRTNLPNHLCSIPDKMEWRKHMDPDLQRGQKILRFKIMRRK